jgi:hypothetical protein
MLHEKQNSPARITPYASRRCPLGKQQCKPGKISGMSFPKTCLSYLLRDEIEDHRCESTPASLAQSHAGGQ